MRATHSVTGGKRTTLWDQFFPSTFSSNPLPLSGCSTGTQLLGFEASTLCNEPSCQCVYVRAQACMYARTCLFLQIDTQWIALHSMY